MLEEADETEFWLELIDTGIVERDKLESLLTENGELVRIFSSSRQTAKAR
jgi:hypothetical protein